MTPQPDRVAEELRACADDNDTPTWKWTLTAIGLLTQAADLLTTQAREIAELRGALEDIANPLGMLQRRAEAEGNRLSGMAYSIANNLGFVQSIARSCLSRLQGESGRLPSDLRNAPGQAGSGSEPPAPLASRALEDADPRDFGEDDSWVHDSDMESR